jgi:Tfp pilus assembly protein PilN
MALHLNLYHEVQKQEIQRQRDPLKLGMYGIAVVVAILLAYYFYRMEQVQGVASRAAQLQTRWQMTDPKAKEAQVLETQLTVSTKTKEDLVQAIENRFYWAPLLERIQKTVPKNVQITSFRGLIEPGTGKGSLSVSGIGAGTEPRKVAEDFRTSFSAKCLTGYNSVDSNFVSLEESDATVQLDGKAQNTALFALQFQFAVAEAVPSATPVQRVPKGAR